MTCIVYKHAPREEEVKTIDEPELDARRWYYSTLSRLTRPYCWVRGCVPFSVRLTTWGDGSMVVGEWCWRCGYKVRP